TDACVRLVDRDVLKAAPFEEHASARDREFLHDTLDHLLGAGATDVRKIDGCEVPGGDESRALGREHEFMQVGGQPAAGRKTSELTIGAVEDHVFTVTQPMLGLPFPPGQDRFALVHGGTEVRRGSVPRWMEPDRHAVVVDYQHTPLSRSRGGRDEEMPRPSLTGAMEHSDFRRLE